MKAIALVIGAVGMLAAGTAGAVDGPAAKSLAQKAGCLACHATDKKLYGPAFREIAAKYRNDKDAETKLMGVIRNGSSGRGPISMPASPQIKESEARNLSQWILGM